MDTNFVPTSKLIALDVGDARVGVALGSIFPSHAEPFATLSRRNGYAENQILKLIQDRLIDTIIVGMPYDAHGKPNQQCSKVEKFCRRIQRRTTARIEFVDEYGSSKDAEEFMAGRPGGKKKSRPKEGIDSDSIAAALILRRYLNGLPNS